MNIYNDLSVGQKAIVRHIFVWGLFSVGLLVLAGAFYYGFRAMQQYEYVRETGTFPLTVSGDGTVYVIPDIATLNLTVRTQAATLKNASNSNNQKNNQLITFLKSKGIDAKDIKTIFYNVTPQYQYDNRPCVYNNYKEEVSIGSVVVGPQSPCPVRQPPKIIGYDVSNSVEVKVRNLDNVGAVLDGAISAGANEVSGPVFTVDNEDKAKNDARAMALESAKKKAKTLADAMGVRLVRISGFSESGGGPIYYGLGKGGGVMESAVAPMPAIEPGQNKIEVTITVTYDVK